MFGLIKQVFIVLLSFSESLVTKCLFSDDELCMVRPTLTDLNPAEFKYYPFMVRLDKYTGSYNVLSSKIHFPKETKDINVKAFNMLKQKWSMAKHISCDLNANSIAQHVIQIKNGIIKYVNVNVKIIISATNIIVGNLAGVFVRIASI